MAVDKLEGQALIEYVRAVARLENGRYGTWRIEQELLPKIEKLPRGIGGPPCKPTHGGKWGTLFAGVIGLAVMTPLVCLCGGQIVISFILNAVMDANLTIFNFPYLQLTFWVVAIGGALGFFKTLHKIQCENEDYQVRYKAYIEHGKAEEEERFAKENAQKAYMEGIIANQLKPAFETATLELRRLYDQDVIFPKYRNIVAVNQILEYLEAGRCDTLSGPSGAYNLYENELRQNLIIDRLDTIIQQLEQIKQNQYLLYDAMCSIGATLSNINAEVSGINANTASIAASSAVTAYNSRFCY